MKTCTARLGTLAVLALGFGCRDQRSLTVPLPSEAAPSNAVSTGASSLWSSVVDGETGPGTTYRIYMPVKWNRKLVVYAQGLIPPFFHSALPAEGDDFAEVFGSQ